MKNKNKKKLYLKPVEGSLDEQIVQLQNIAMEINSWTLDADRKVLEQLNLDARRIGEELYRQGGRERMLQAYQLAGAQRVIESAWDGIETWKKGIGDLCKSS